MDHNKHNNFIECMEIKERIENNELGFILRIYKQMPIIKFYLIHLNKQPKSIPILSIPESMARQKFTSVLSEAMKGFEFLLLELDPFNIG